MLKLNLMHKRGYKMKIYLKNKDGEFAQKSKVFSIRIPESLLLAVQMQAAKENRSANNLIETVLKREAEKGGWLK